MVSRLQKKNNEILAGIGIILLFFSQPSANPVFSQTLPSDGSTEEPQIEARGTGLNAEYFASEDFSNKRESRQESAIDFDWGAASPAPDIPVNGWSARWTGQLEAPKTGDYYLSAYANGRVRVWLRKPGKKWTQRLHAWREDPNMEAFRNTLLRVPLEVGIKYDIKVEFQDDIGNASLKLLWRYDSQSTEIIPSKYLYPIKPERPPEIQGLGTGTNALYFNNAELQGWPETRREPNIDFEWGSESPIERNAVRGTWSARFTGKLEIPESSYKFRLIVRANGGVRIWIREPNVRGWLQIADRWEDNGTSIDTRAEIPFYVHAGKKYDLQVEYKNEVGDGLFKLLWEDEQLALSVIPSEFLYPEQLIIPIGVEGRGTGLEGYYFHNANLTNFETRRDDATVDFNWGRESPDPDIDPDSYSVRWMGQIEPRYSERYGFYVRSDGLARLWIDGKLILDNRGMEELIEYSSAVIALQAGRKYDVRLEYSKGSNNATAGLLWSSPSQPKEIIPTPYLYPQSESSLWVRWERTIQPERDGVYTFEIVSTEPVRVWIDETLMIDAMEEAPVTSTNGSFPLNAGQEYSISVEYREDDNEPKGGRIKLDWYDLPYTRETLLQRDEAFFERYLR